MVAGTGEGILCDMNPPRNPQESFGPNQGFGRNEPDSPPPEASPRAAAETDDEIGIPSGYLERTFASKRSPVSRRAWSEAEKES
jgi:hypothetical protein